MESTALLILGAGKLGRILLRQLADSESFHREKHGVGYRLVAWADSTGAFVSPRGLPFELLAGISARKESGATFAEQGAEGGDGDARGRALSLVDDLSKESGPPPLLVDVTSSDETGTLLLAALDRGLSVATANKLPLAGKQDFFDRLTSTPRFLYEATVASAVPVIETCLGLLRNGDKVDAFTGALSGTIGFLMTGLEDGKPFSRLVKTAMERGYTEKDPRADLGGEDVARKALILARTLGRRLEFADIALQALVPTSLSLLSVEDFLEALPGLDRDFAQRVAKARAASQALRYAAAMDEGGVAVGPVAVPKGSALGSLRGNDNLLAISSMHYPELPLVLQGRGNGVEAAAAAVHGNIIELLIAERFRR
ncbi:MAG TPA: hypothetical protein VMV44_02165 [Rectinemataceae bacterium]|nr:hypothetical protein [Rectinemataceae bacterium]